ncbi:FAD dependent oxidoreductase [Anaerobacterium chartisolvens]|uniref:FAD dependent oxidoreductase n=1 Tax=Anaerobacterium chartisolvens TaxID=1297424 RepID=A0A369AVY5_9FIRM|nr:FAD-dependent oxidoreductase [Anaerobacterium chartisolvens]RCX12377.1 FAD dependent oxidoreductase [Anaerobacterium chartisolvens]
MKRDFVVRLFALAIIAILLYRFGIVPITRESARDWTKGLVSDNGIYDVIVVGEEPEGISAATASARAGARTLLVAEGKGLGGSVSKSLAVDMEASYGPGGEALNKGFYGEISRRIGTPFVIDNYIRTVEDIVKKQKSLDVIYSAGIVSPIFEGMAIKGVNIKLDGEERSFYGKRFIDATVDGILLKMCNVPCFKGSEDLNMPDSYMPVRLNFMLRGVEAEGVPQIQNRINSIVSRYRLSYIDSDVRNIAIIPQGGGRAVMEGIRVLNVDVSDPEALKVAYDGAVQEAVSLTRFLKEETPELKGIEFEAPARELLVKESVHFMGEYVLEVKDILENRDFPNKGFVCSRPVDAGKFAGKGTYVVGKPVQYSVPLGSLVPLKTDNLMMVGRKASYSSLASSSAGGFAAGISAGQSAGIVSVYSIINNYTPREVANEKDADKVSELQGILRAEGAYLPDIKEENPLKSSWAYPSIIQLASLGLISGGEANNYLLQKDATQNELVTLLINGIFRLAPDRYSLELDSLLRRYASESKLTGEMAAAILLSLHNEAAEGGAAYEKARDKGYIDGFMNSRLSDEGILKIEDVFYLADYAIREYTGKGILS